MRLVLGRALRVLSSLGLSCALLVLLGLLTWLGTLEQVHTGLYEVQRKYFESFFLLHDAGPISIPLPGANLVLCLLFLNLFAGGMVRLRKGWSTAGVLVTHLGIALLLVSGFVKAYFSDDGHVTLFEGQRSQTFQSYFRWEIAILEDLGGGRVREYLVPGEHFTSRAQSGSVTFVSPELPFRLEVERFLSNCQPTTTARQEPAREQALPVVDGVALQELPSRNEAEANIAGAYVALLEADGGRRQPGILWGAGGRPWTTTAAGKTWAIELRKERYAMPFTLVLDDFVKEDHPRSDMPKAFSSTVTVVEGATSRPVRISMNEPLRTGGLVLYQASWGPASARPGDPLFSTFAVVRNPADQLPLCACIVIAAGLCFHFTRKLVRHVRSEVRTA